MLELIPGNRSLVIATTHLQPAEVLCRNDGRSFECRDGIQRVTLAPTYRPDSRTVRRFEWPKNRQTVANAAKGVGSAVGFLDAADVDAAHYVEELRRRIVDLEREQERLESERNEFDDWKQKELAQLKAQHREEIAKVEKKLERIVQEMSARASREFDAARDDSAKKFQKKLANVKADAAREIGREKERIEPPVAPPPSAAPASSHVLGTEDAGRLVRVLSLAVTGTISAVRGDEAEVLVGNIKLRRPFSDLEIVEMAPIQLPRNVHVNVSLKEFGKNEINLVGRQVDEAVEMTDKFLDDAFLAQVSIIRIVHGMGTGRSAGRFRSCSAAIPMSVTLNRRRPTKGGVGSRSLRSAPRAVFRPSGEISP